MVDNLYERDYFNSRSREGATIDAVAVIFRAIISIHAPVRERQCLPIAPRGPAKFQFTLP